MIRGAIAVSQLALAMILLVSAGLLIKTSIRVQQADMDFNPENVLTFRTNLPEERYKDPVGQKLMFTFEGTEKEPVWRTIVGVVHAVKTPTRSRTKAKGRSFFPSSRYLCSL